MRKIFESWAEDRFKLRTFETLSWKIANKNLRFFKRVPKNFREVRNFQNFFKMFSIIENYRKFSVIKR